MVNSTSMHVSHVISDVITFEQSLYR
jgi:hypothetical protein